jgi:Tol biopolymer transport system component
MIRPRLERVRSARTAAGVVLLVLLTLVGGPAASARVPASAAPRLLFAASVVSGSSLHPRGEPSPDIYSLSASGQLAQLSFTGGAGPVPSPDGRLIAFARAGDLWLMSADGRRQRLLVRNAVGLAWVGDSRTIAYARLHAKGIRVIGADGRGDRLLVAGDAVAPRWSPDGRSLAFLQVHAEPVPGGSRFTYTLAVRRGGKERLVGPASSDAPSWSPDGRWLAYTASVGGGTETAVVLVHPDGSNARVIDSAATVYGTPAIHHPVWSPRGRLLAYFRSGAISLFDEASGKRRTLVPAQGWPAIDAFAWSPDGRQLAYEAFDSENEVTEIFAVSLSGRIRVLGGYPEATGIVWTTPPAGLHYRPPAPVGPVAVGDELRFRVPVDELAADGDRVAYQACGTVGAWQPSSGSVTAVRSELPLCNFEDNYLQFFDLMLAGDVVGYGTDEGGIQQNVQLRLSTLADPTDATTVAGGNWTRPGPLDVGFLLGSGPLIVFSTWNTGCNGPATPCPDASGPQPLWRLPLPLVPGTCARTGVELALPCRRIADGPAAPLAVDASRMVVLRSDGSLALLDAEARQLRSLPFVPGAVHGAALAGSDLVVIVPHELRDYDAATGTLLHSWPLLDVATAGVCGIELWRCGSPRLRFEGAANGLAVYLLDDQIHLLRLRDGADVVVGNGTAAQVEDSGLFYAHQATGTWPGRIRFVPFDQLPLR